MSINRPLEIQEARDILATALQLAKNYDGSEVQTEAVLQVGIEYEAVFNTLSKKQQQTLRDVGDVLEISLKTLQKNIAALQAGTRQALACVFKKREEVLLPPGTGHITSGDSASEFKEGAYTPRLERLIEHLQAIEIYTDDIIITEGGLQAAQMRNQAYSLIEIPRLQAEILVCNQVGEATFVSQAMRGFNYYTRHTKEQLLEQDGIVKVVDNNDANWWTEIAEVLQESELREKVNVKQLDEVRRAIQAELTAEEWVKMTVESRNVYKIFNLWLISLARIFSLENEMNQSRFSQFELGIKIFGEQPTLLKAISAEKEQTKMDLKCQDTEWLRTEIQAAMTAEEWLAMSTNKRSKWKIHGQVLISIARIFSIEGDVRSSLLLQLKLGLKIFGENPALRKAINEEEAQKKLDEKCQDIEWLRAEIQAVMTAEEWVQMGFKKCGRFKFKNQSITDIARNLEMDGEIRKDRILQLELGLKIFGEHKVIEEAIIAEKTRKIQSKKCQDIEWLRAEIQAVMTAEEWAKMSWSKRKNWKIHGKKFIALGTLFGVSDVNKSALAQLELGIVIFGKHIALRKAIDEEEAQKKLDEKCQDIEWLRAEIQAVMTAEEWTRMGHNERIKWSIHGQGLGSLKTIFELHGDIWKSEKIQLELGVAIFGEHRDLKWKLQLNEEKEEEKLRYQKNNQLLVHSFLRNYPINLYLKMTNEERRCITIATMTLHEIAKTLGFNEKVAGKTLPQLQLGLKIYGEHPLLLQAIAEEEARLAAKK